MKTFSLLFEDKKIRKDHYIFLQTFLKKKLYIISIFGLISSLILAIILFTQSLIIIAILNIVFFLIFLIFTAITYKFENHLKLTNFLMSLYYTIVIYEYYNQIDTQKNALLLGLFSHISQIVFSLGSEWFLTTISLCFNSIYCLLRHGTDNQYQHIYIIYAFFLIMAFYLIYFQEAIQKRKYFQNYISLKENQLWYQVFMEYYPLAIFLFRRDRENPNKNEFSYYLKNANHLAMTTEILNEDDFISFTKKVLIECKVKDAQRSHRFFAIEKEEMSTLFEILKTLCGTIFFKKDEKNSNNSNKKKREKDRNTQGGKQTAKNQNPTKTKQSKSNSNPKNNLQPSEESFVGNKKLGKNSESADSFQYKIYNYYGRYQKSSKSEHKIHIIIIFFSWFGETNFFFTMEDIQNQLELHTYRKINSLSSSIIEKINGELVTPLNRSIILLDQALTEISLDEKLKLIELAKLDSNLLLHSLNDILDFFRLKKNCFKLDNVQFSLGLLLNEVTDLIKHQCYSKGIMIKITNNCELLLTVFSDPRRLMQILINLISNALKFTLKGYIEIIVNPYKFDNYNLIKFEILDTGSGIKKESLPNLFVNKNENKSFEDLALNNNEEKDIPELSVDKYLYSDLSAFGRGLGLLISKYLVGYIGPVGEIYVSSESQKGSKFGFLMFENMSEKDEYLKNRKGNANSKKLNLEDTFTNYLTHLGDPSCLIRIDEDEPLNYSIRKFPEFSNVFDHRIESEGNINEEYKDYIYVPTKKKLNLLIVDENAFMIHALNNMLKKIAEYQINSDFCTNGLNALDLFEKNNYITSKSCYDFVILNCQMQYMSGYFVAKKIKDKIDKEHYKKTVIIGFSSVNTAEEETYCKNQGIKILINKISSEQEIITKLRKIFKET